MLKLPFSTIGATSQNPDFETQSMNTPPAAANLLQIVLDYICLFGMKIAEATGLVLPGQGFAACIFLAAGELRFGLPRKAGFSLPGDPNIIWANLATWGHGAIREFRKKLLTGELTGKTYVFMSGHPMSTEARQAYITNQALDAANVVFIALPLQTISKAHISGAKKAQLVQEVVELANQNGITKSDWEAGRVLTSHAGLGALLTLRALILYRLGGQWPRLVRIVPGAPGDPNRFIDVLELQPLREVGRSLEFKGAPVQVSQEFLRQVATAENMGDVQTLIATVFPGGMEALLATEVEVLS